MQISFKHSGSYWSVLSLLGAIVIMIPMTAFSPGVGSLIIISFHFIHVLEMKSGDEPRLVAQTKMFLTLVYGALVLAAILKLFYP